jgi:hypothetical protein
MSWFYFDFTNIDVLPSGSNVTSMNDCLSKPYICPVCQKKAILTFKRQILSQTDRFPLSIVSIHVDKTDPHLLLFYVDANGSIRGVEKIQYTDLEIRLNNLIKTSNPKEKKALIDEYQKNLEKYQIKNC